MEAQVLRETVSEMGTVDDGDVRGRRGAGRTNVAMHPPCGAVPRDRAVRFYAYVTAVVGVAVLGAGPTVAGLLGVLGAMPSSFWVIAGLAVLLGAVPLVVPGLVVPGRGSASTAGPSVAFTFAALLGWGLGPAVGVAASAVVASSIRLRDPPWRVVLAMGQYAVALAASALMLDLFGVAALSPGGRAGVLHVVGILGAACVWIAVHGVLSTTELWLLGGGSWPRTLMQTLRADALSTLALLAFGLVAVAVGTLNAVVVPILLVPLFVINRLARRFDEQRRSSSLDELTGLPNRGALFEEMTVQARSYAERSSRVDDGRRMALLLLDIDRFRRVNDALGHAVGDRLLGAVAERLRECIGADGYVARLGGDEFAVLAPRLVDVVSARILAERVADALAEPVTLDGLPLDVTAAIGLAVHPDHGTDNTTLLRHAEVAMYDAKNRGATYALYTAECDHNSPERLELLAELRRALDLARPDEIQMVYQPQIDMITAEVVGVEALLRWHHPKRGPISPEDVIKVTEHTAVMRRLTTRVLEDVIAQLAKWKAQGLNLRASINVSVRDLQRPELVEQLAGMLADRGVSPGQLQLEITEGALMADPRRVLVTLHRLDKLGVALSLDDFGTGYSSLQHLRRLPLAEVKIDRSFVLGMATDPDDAAIVGSIIDLARALGLRVVAEGVEDDRTRRMLVHGGCEVAQGWHFARPMPADALVSWLARYHPFDRRRGGEPA
jgi:diguanylate cyclase (GGDEF)-like protein